jgi:hypothetical protein
VPDWGASRSSGEWRDDYDFLADGVVVGHIKKDRGSAGRNAVAVDAGLPPPRGQHADARLRGDAQGGGVPEELAAGVRMT